MGIGGTAIALPAYCAGCEMGCRRVSRSQRMYALSAVRTHLSQVQASEVHRLWQGMSESALCAGAASFCSDRVICQSLLASGKCGIPAQHRLDFGRCFGNRGKLMQFSLHHGPVPIMALSQLLTARTRRPDRDHRDESRRSRRRRPSVPPSPFGVNS
jgi:hypothetical protein